jgi:alginate O-acetyltransferase complex protein AlgI
VGISFYTFQSLSYTIDIYRGRMEPVDRFEDYALYVAFFPQLVAGPIERATRLLPQIAAPRTLPPGYLSEGAFLIFWGLFKKIFIADNLAALLAYVGDPADAGAGAGGMVLATTYAFTFQLYADFSAYSDIARGTARLMGFDIMVNFRSPLFAPNIQETWNRWHISLTSWIRDYIYYPLALTRMGRRHPDVRAVAILTFLVMGLWHGAAWGYILWGGYNGLLLAGYGTISPFLRRRKKRMAAPEPVRRAGFGLSVFLTFHCMVLGALLFRGESLGQIGAWLRLLAFDFGWTPWTTRVLVRSFAYAAPLLAADLILYRHEDVTRLFGFPRPLRYAFLYLALFLMVVFHAPASHFVYFQF